MESIPEWQRQYLRYHLPEHDSFLQLAVSYGYFL